MALLIDSYSNELAQVNPPNYAPLKPNQLSGRVRLATFSLNTGAGLADDDHVAVLKLPKGARIVGGRICNEAMGAGATLDIGLMGADNSGFINAAGDVADDDDMLGAALDVDGVLSADFADTVARNILYETEKEVFLVLTVEGAAWAANKDVTGYIQYVVD